MKNSFILISAAFLCSQVSVGKEIKQNSAYHLESPAGERYTRINKEGSTVLPNGRLVTPYGKQVQTAPHPFGMVLSEDGNTLVTVNGGTGPFSLSVIRELEKENPTVTQIPPTPRTDKKVLSSVFIGIAIDSKKDVMYVSEGDNGNIGIFKWSTGEKTSSINLSTEKYPDSYLTDIVLSPDGTILYVLDLANYRLILLDTKSLKEVSSIGVGRNPFALVQTTDGKRIYVANMGKFQYSLIETRAGDDARGISFPPFGYPSKEAEEGTIIEGRKVPGLGKPNVPEACSVWGIDVAHAESPKVITRIRTGLPMGQVIGGSSPAGLAVYKNTLYVTNSINDSVEAYNITSHKRVWRTLLTTAPFVNHLRGINPFGLAVIPDGKKIYVAESGINAVGVLDRKTGKLLGHIPVGWYPARVSIAPDGKTIYVSNAKGYGAGPNGGVNFKETPAGTYIGRLMKGSVSIFQPPSDKELIGLTQRVLENNGFVKQPGKAPLLNMQKNIKYVVFITKENRTFDEVFGDMVGVNGDSTLARFGMNRTIRPPDVITDSTMQVILEHVNVMPNHRSLAKQFSLSDNFYVDSDVSADGHRWLVGIYPNHWVETMTAASYGGGVSFMKSKAPGRLAMFESNSSMDPEDYNEAGSMWENFARNKITFRNYGEGLEFAGISEGEDTKPTGARLPVNFPMPEPLFENTSRDYPTFNVNIPDQYRADKFIHELNTRYLSGKYPFPRYINLYVTNDHGAKEKPKKGYPYLHSYMADNDMAVGRIIEALSHTPYWKNMAVFITEDDAQSGDDHVDAHRSFVLAISPWVKHGYVSHRHTSIASITKSIYELLGMPSLNLYDAAASDLGDMFTDKPDFTPYQAIPSDKRIFNPAIAKDPNDPDYKNVKGDLQIDTPEESMRQLHLVP